MQGESIDNFNWGVRRPSLSHLDGGAGSGLDGELSSAQESFNEVTPVLPKRETNAGVGAEESSDDETGSITVSSDTFSVAAWPQLTAGLKLAILFQDFIVLLVPSLGYRKDFRWYYSL